MKTGIKHHKYDIALLTLVLLSALTMLLASTDPLWKALEGTIGETILITNISGNNVLFNLSTGILVSYIFYLIVIYFPTKREKYNTRDSLCNEAVLVMMWGAPLHSKIKNLNDINNIEELIKELIVVNKFTDIEPLFIKEWANDSLNIYESLLPIAATISSEHLKRWSIATKNLRAIAKTDDEKEMFRYFLYFLEHIKNFRDEKI
ncbi:hypothetical protein P8629_09275 [Hydrogenovibrio sp. 3SP14C1]|uniref:hypothetical protein n=1 Tax=Hydrogenovibrio sp. 3SP14C1 TaxID=3038774 RepID=UPI002415DA9C|nr:hypothetical protein [Hydrogenovibrio sp. 3SP14C1]MDG4813194.1 hypothetical protein [Hydrogenovibrio sp. 3SP14C1]